MQTNRKYLKTIYSIQESFGANFGGVTRTFPFGIRPDEERKYRLKEWFSQVSEAKKELYFEIYKDYLRNPSKYLDSSFDYETFFKGSSVLKKIRRGRNLITSLPIMEGLRIEINGSIRSFISNYKRLSNENKELAKKIESTISENNKRLKEKKVDPVDYGELRTLINKIKTVKYVKCKQSLKKIDSLESLVSFTNNKIGEYNYGVNQISNAENFKLFTLPRLYQVPVFPASQDIEVSNQEELIKELEKLAGKVPERKAASRFLAKRIKTLKHTRPNRKKRFEDRVLAWLKKKHPAGNSKLIEEYPKILDKKLEILKMHFENKPYDAPNRNYYFRLLSFRARLGNPSKNVEINESLSRLRGSFLRGKEQKEIITISGFSWSKAVRGKPNKGIALAFKDGELYACISPSMRNFIVDPEGNLRFLKTVGGQKRRNSQPKQMLYVNGRFDAKNKVNLPLFLKLHFGKSYARRYLFHKSWGVFSETPQIFLNNARLKREKKRPGDEWKYYLDVILSGERPRVLREFRDNLLAQAETVIGIDRGEANPVAFSVVRVRDKKIIKTGFFAELYTQKLMEYVAKRIDYQSRGRSIPKYLTSKVYRLKKTMLETAVSEILHLVGQYNGVVAIENLDRRFKGAERKVIPKRTYLMVEKLLANSLQLAGILRINENQEYNKYWGALLTVSPSGTSQRCHNCDILWNAELKKRIVNYSKAKNLKNVDIKAGILIYNKMRFQLNREFKVYTKKRYPEDKSLEDIIDNPELLSIALGPRISQSEFRCAKCGYEGHADIVAAVNIASRGIEIIERLTQSS